MMKMVTVTMRQRDADDLWRLVEWHNTDNRHPWLIRVGNRLRDALK